ncbi:EAL domain-containing protein [Solirubrobacter sp. CPCC 204708]|uniref:EAL domain-containing protein n=1 Tax=Solirubrobacter deserti TaxID=2282478 RepID=A0ABT4RKH1_9ACTN|nr:EAL domain-containing protein [Solirubrobacter deserti]MBE2316790.1 EAL domain-containing protein [Solirubrobacter deserti]MDA0138995.1 EAL domain-containing protein [Solirubrobacter deserti]
MTVLVGALVTLGLWLAGSRLDAERAALRDDEARAAAVGALRLQLTKLSAQVEGLASLFEASRNVTRAEFDAYTRDMFENSEANSFGYIRRIEAAERAATERRLGVRVRELRPDGAMVLAGERPEYAVIEEIRDAGRGRNIVGLDLLVDPVRRRALERAARTGELGATGPIALAQRDERGFAVYARVGNDPRQFVVGSLTFRRLDQTVERALVRDTEVAVAVAGQTVIGAPRARSAPSGAVEYGGVRMAVQADAPSGDGIRYGALGLLVGPGLTALALIIASAWRARRRLAVGELRFADAFEASPVGQALASPDGRFARVNAALGELTGHTQEQLAEMTCVDLVDPRDHAAVSAMLREALERPGVGVGREVRLAATDGVARYVQVHLIRLRDRDAAHPVLTQVIDVSEQRGLEVELRHQAEHDALTELLNRRGFQRRLDALLTGPDAARGAVMLLDLDHFKAVNDTLGHHVGDQVIRAAGHALSEAVRSGDIVARIGGDEFAVLLPGASDEHAHMTADRLVAAVSTGSVVPDITGLHSVSASAGYAMLDGDFANADEALMAADLAMYDAKAAGRRRAARFDHRSASSTQTRLRWVDRIRTALAEERFVLLAQPIQDLDSGSVVHHELLLRMLGREGEQIAPGSFVPIAEQFGLMEEIDRWVVTRAIAALGANRDRDLIFEVNLSGSSLGSTELLAAIADALEAHRFAADRLIFEITETTAVTNLEEAQAFASALARLGCRFALDDFGVGFGSFTYVKHLPFDFLKIDGEFVRNSASSATDRVILESLIHAARGLGKRTIAEYVEDAATVDLLQGLGVDMAQGFHVGRPRDLTSTIAAAALTRR